jgi:hypothetical protein
MTVLLLVPLMHLAFSKRAYKDKVKKDGQMVVRKSVYPTGAMYNDDIVKERQLKLGLTAEKWGNKGLE